MKILHLSDLHIWDKPRLRTITNFVGSEVWNERPDVVVITGDIFESCYRVDPYKRIAELIDDDEVVVICTLGNHEFLERTVEGTLKYYEDYYDPDKYNVHYLDLIGKYDIGKVRFLGNVLWYDGSMSTIKNQRLDTFADGAWCDWRIKKFDWRAECAKNMQIIRDNISEYKVNVLCTHTVPHHKLNMHMSKTMSMFNAYSGVYDFLETIEVEYALCGHTHWRTVGGFINGCMCSNVGCDYDNLKTFYFDIVTEQPTEEEPQE